MHRLEEAALSRAIHGVPRPIFYKGEQVGEWRHHDERMAMFLLRYRRPLRYGSQLDRLPPPPPLPGSDAFDLQPDPDEAMSELEWQMGDLIAHGDAPATVDEARLALDGGNFGNFAPDCDGDDAPLERGP